ncbi:TPA: hypothetical protein HA228_02615 [Candidatus Woesearchaeota archaeon]|nr:MAG: hypothetical protein QT04_C0050G0008 [archaeon GW2011_AR11]MBS3111235.1 hypothetical protein [Candidatus Woesearchaeota archaeon]HIH05088.1 hypothetical protein [Candidatus Woesearchaeota archaeon]
MFGKVFSWIRRKRLISVIAAALAAPAALGVQGHQYQANLQALQNDAKKVLVETRSYHQTLNMIEAKVKKSQSRREITNEEVVQILEEYQMIISGIYSKVNIGTRLDREIKSVVDSFNDMRKGDEAGRQGFIRVREISNGYKDIRSLRGDCEKYLKETKKLIVALTNDPNSRDISFEEKAAFIERSSSVVRLLVFRLEVIMR